MMDESMTPTERLGQYPPIVLGLGVNLLRLWYSSIVPTRSVYSSDACSSLSVYVPCNVTLMIR